MKEISLKEMLGSAMHFGHKTQKWNPKMKSYIYGKRGGIHIFDLQKTAKEMQKMLDFVHQSVLDGKRIIFVSTKQHTAEILKDIHKTTGMPIVTHRWVGGMLTNFNTIKERIRKYKQLTKEEESNELSRYTKKEQIKIKKEIKKLDDTFSGIADMFSIPEVMFVVDACRESTAIKEGHKLGMDVVGICDTNADPDVFDYFIPANDDALKSVTYVLEFVKEVILDAQKSKPKAKKDEVVKMKHTEEENTTEEDDEDEDENTTD